MKPHTTNYINTFIEVAEDCPVSQSLVPPLKKEKTVANLHYKLLIESPYQHTSDDVIFESFAQKRAIPEDEKEFERNLFFSKGQACMRCSPLTKRYGYGIHSDSEGKIALVPMESEAYRNFLKNDSVKKVKAMKSKKL